MVHNVHERAVPVPVSELGPLLDRLGGPDDPLWPAPPWEPMVLDGPLAEHPEGGHGAIRYRVTAYEPGRRVEFTFPPGRGLDGTHTLSVDPDGTGGSVLRHVLVGRTNGRMRLLWPLLIRWLHDAVLEDLLDRAEAELGVGPTQQARWTPIAALFQRFTSPRALRTAVPDTRLLATALRRVDFSDAYALACRTGADTDPQAWADAIFRRPSASPLMVLRDKLVGLLGIEPSTRSTFAVVGRAGDEVLIGTDDKHLDFRVSVLREADRAVVSTVVEIHNLRGHLYFAVVRLLHPVIVRTMLTRAARELSRSSNTRGVHHATMDA